jgi:biotin carboxyl carrier protein
VADEESPVEFCYLLRGVEHKVHLEEQPDGSMIARIGERSYHVQFENVLPMRLDLVVDGRRYQAVTGSRNSGKAGLQRRYVALFASATSGEVRSSRHYELTRVTSRESRPDGRDGLPHRRSGVIQRGSLEAAMPGQVSQVMVNVGDWVAAGQPLLVLEAMKMSTRVVAPLKGRVSRLLVQEGETVERGQRLVEVEPAAEEEA